MENHEENVKRMKKKSPIRAGIFIALGQGGRYCVYLLTNDDDRTGDGDVRME